MPAARRTSPRMMSVRDIPTSINLAFDRREPTLFYPGSRPPLFS
jgi:hypothetical protein